VLGTALGEPHIRVLKRFAETVVLILDGDQAGQRRADEVLELFVSADVDLRILSLPDGLDPADFLAQRGTPAFTEAVGQAPDAIEHKLRRLTEGLDLTVETHRATQALEAMLAILAKLPPATNALRLQQTLLRLARTFTVPVETLQSRLEQLRRQQRPARRPSERPTVRPEKKNHPPASAAGDQAGPRDPSEALGGNGIDDPEAAENWDAATGLMPAAASDPIGGLDRELFEILIEQPDFVPQAVETIDPAWLTSDSARELLRKYQEHELAGLSLDARDVLLTIENETLKNQLVAMDSRVQQKINAASQTPASRFESIMERYREIEIRAETQMHLTRLDQGLVSEEEELAVLGELFAAQRLRHGLTGRNDQDS
jgi:DNA primase